MSLQVHTLSPDPRDLRMGLYLEMRSLKRGRRYNEVTRGVLIPQEWCPYKKRRSGPRHTQRDDHVRTQGRDGRLHAQERGLGRNQPC